MWILKVMHGKIKICPIFDYLLGNFRKVHKKMYKCIKVASYNFHYRLYNGKNKNLVSNSTFGSSGKMR